MLTTLRPEMLALLKQSASSSAKLPRSVAFPDHACRECAATWPAFRRTLDTLRPGERCSINWEVFSRRKLYPLARVRCRPGVDLPTILPAYVDSGHV